MRGSVTLTWLKEKICLSLFGRCGGKAPWEGFKAEISQLHSVVKALAVLPRADSQLNA
jgi:hypothetical protein